MTTNRCPWCLDSTSEAEEGLCRTHQAEYEGLSEAELDRRDREELLDRA